MLAFQNIIKDSTYKAYVGFQIYLSFFSHVLRCFCFKKKKIKNKSVPNIC